MDLGRNGLLASLQTRSMQPDVSSVDGLVGDLRLFPPSLRKNSRRSGAVCLGDHLVRGSHRRSQGAGRHLGERGSASPGHGVRVRGFWCALRFNFPAENVVSSNLCQTHNRIVAINFGTSSYICVASRF